MESARQIGRKAANPTVAAVLLLLAGVVALAGSAFGWARVSYPTLPGGGRGLSVAATEAVGHGRAALYLGLFLVVSAVIALAIPSRETKRAWLVTGIACGVALGALAVFDLLTLRSRTVDHLVSISSGTGFPPGQIARLIIFSFKPGIYAAILAGGLALAAAVLLFMGRPRPEHHEPEPVAQDDDQP